jgi:hypothetical protein
MMTHSHRGSAERSLMISFEQVRMERIVTPSVVLAALVVATYDGWRAIACHIKIYCYRISYVSLFI